ncbi:MAG TPA: DUF3662 and FHA domain-containing protein [Mycobacteriales bacterium]|nr:DUF3662 and FHA domain-containing protein [Mycobacteriales bacterium]
MGVLQRFERRLEGLIEGTFAKVFRGGVEPVEIAKALQREAADRKAVSATRVLVPNDFVVELGRADHERLAPYAVPLGRELAAMVREEAAEHRWSFVGPVTVALECHDDIDTGVFRVRSAVAEGELDSGYTREVAALRPATATLLVAGPPGQPPQTVELRRDILVIGRGSDADVRVSDSGVSRRHAELRREGDDFVFVDLGSTNGSLVNGRRAERVRLSGGDRIQLGRTTLVFERADA